VLNSRRKFSQISEILAGITWNEFLGVLFSFFLFLLLINLTF